MNILELAILKKMVGGGGGSGTDNYNDLSNLPKINDTTLSGNKSSSALGLQSEITSDSKLASDLVDDTNQDNKFVTSTEKNTWNGKQNAIDADHKINADYVDDSTSTNKFVTASDKETWNAKQNAIDNSHKLSSDLVDDTNHTNKFVTSTEKNTWNAKQNAIDADHKLSSSLVSFSTAEAAALASGIDSSKVGQISTNQTNILSTQNMAYKTAILSDKIVRLTENKDGYAYITSTAGDVIKSVGKNLINPANYDYTTGSGNVTCVSAADGSVTISVTEGYKWTLNGNLTNSVKIPITKTGTLYFVVEHISGTICTGNAPTTPTAGGHQTVLYDSSNNPISDYTEYSLINVPAELTTALRTFTITPEMIQANAVYLQIRIWSNGTNSGGRIIDNYKFRIAAYFDDSSITDATPYQQYKESIETCDASGHCYIMTYEDGSVYSQNDYPTKTITVDYPESDFAVRFNESEKAVTENILSVKDMVCDDAFSTSKSYAVDDITIYDNKLYKFKNAHQGAWSASDVDQISLSEQNSDLTYLEAEDRAALAEVVDSGAKNLIPAQFVTSTYNGASFVWGENGSFTASRVSEGVYATYNILKNFELPVGDYVLSIGSALIANYAVTLVLSDSSVKTLDSTTDTYVGFTISQGLSINYLYVSVGINATSSVTIYPMICSKADWDISSKYKPYVPYDIRKAVETNSTINNDLNNCIDTSVIYRCINSSSVPANCPNFKFNDVSSFEMTCTTPMASMILQELKPNSVATLPRIYYRRRTGTGTEQSPYVWSNWETMNCRYPLKTGINYNDCDETGFYEVMGTATSNTQNSPNGNNASNNFFVIAQRRDAVYIKQIACDVRTTDVYNRNCVNGTWSDWVKLATASDIAALEARIQALENA